jgi:hypothetical protein
MKSRALIAVLVLAVAATAVYAGRRYFAAAKSASLDHSSETHEKVTEIRISSKLREFRWPMSSTDNFVR